MQVERKQKGFLNDRQQPSIFGFQALLRYHNILELVEIERPKTYDEANVNKDKFMLREGTKYSPETGSQLQRTGLSVCVKPPQKSFKHDTPFQSCKPPSRTTGIRSFRNIM